MDGVEIVRRVRDVADEEPGLERSHAQDGVSCDELDRPGAIEVALDQCWHLLGQFRARHIAGQDPDDAAVRPEGVVESCQQ